MATAQRWPTFLLMLSAFLAAFPSTTLVSAASFSFALSTPIQCSNMTVTVQGGTPPYQLVIIPSGTETPEYRKIIALNLTDTTATFKLTFNTGSQFVALMSDATGFGTGGTSTATTVSASDDDSCLTKTPDPDFFFFMAPTGYLAQCQTTTLSWQTSPPNAADGAVSIYGIIPGGESFLLSPNKQPYQWPVNVRQGTSVTLFAGDSRGPGTGGSAGPFVVNGTDSSCINSSSPSSTAGSPAGAVTGAQPSSTSGGATVSTTPTSTTASAASSTTGAASGGGGGKSSSHTGAIVGGVVGGIVGLAIIGGLLFFFCCMRRRKDDPEAEAANRRTLDLAGGDEEPHTPPSRTGPPMIEQGFYHPEPFVVPEVGSSRPSTDIGHGGGGGRRGGSSIDLAAAGAGAGLAASSHSGRPDRERRVSQATLSSSDPSGVTPSSRRNGTGTAAGKTHPPSSMRPANFVQHEDAGQLDPNAPVPNSEQVVELPPTYSTIRPKKVTNATPGDA